MRPRNQCLAGSGGAAGTPPRDPSERNRAFPEPLPLDADFRETAGMNDSLAPDALALHRALVTLDTHIDIPWPPGPEPFQDGPRKVDMPKMRRGGLSAGCFVAYVPQAA